MRSLWLPDMDWVGDRRAINVAVVGDECHGKTTLVASLVLAQHERLGVPLPALTEDYFDPVHHAFRGVYSSTMAGTSVPTATTRRVLNLIDSPGGMRGLVEALRLVGMADGVLLVVSAECGVTTHTRSMAFAANRAGVRNLVGFVNLWGDPELSFPSSNDGVADAAETELRRLLLDAGYPGDDLPVVRGATWANLRDHRSPPPAWVDEVLYAIETGMPTPPRDDGAALLMLRSDDNYFGGSASESDYEGVVRRGVLSVGMPVEFVGGGAVGEVAYVHAIRRGNRLLEEALPGDIVTAVFRNTFPYRADIIPCHALVEPGSSRAARKLVARLTVLTPEQGGRHRGMPSGMCPRFAMGTAAFRAPIVMGSSGAILKPGETGVVEIETASFGYLYGPKGILCEPGQGFVCRDGGRVIAVGEVEAVAE